MKSVNPNIYTKKFYLTECLGSEEFKKSNGAKLHPNVIRLLERISLTPSMRVLDIGCGRGDITIHLAKKVKEVVGIDYAKNAIAIANSLKKKTSESIKKKLTFSVMNMRNLTFPDNYFDAIVCIDVFEHLYKEELEIAMKELSRVLKKNGTLFVHTGTNKVLYDYTYRYYILPMNKLLTSLDKHIKHVTYPSLPSDPRIPVEKKQHVNEPTYFYLKNLFKKYHFKGVITTDTGYKKEGVGFRTTLYNFLICLYPFSQYYPLSIFFAWAFICTMKNKKS